MTLPKRFVSLFLIYCWVLTIAPHSCAALPLSNQSKTATPETTDNSSVFSSAYDALSTIFLGSKAADNEDDNQEQGLRFRLSEAAEQPEARAVNKVATAAVLSDAETQAIISRLPPISTTENDQADFAVRERSLPPPRTGATLLQPFPAANEIARPAEQPAGALEVVRYSPDGEIPIAPNLSVTFSRPMVAITSQEEAAQSVPVKLSPQPPGKWHWIGTKTLLFEPDTRFPMATKYSVSVPAGTQSAGGGALAATKSWTFTTPPPTAKTKLPDDSVTQRRDKLMFIEFDQRIDPAGVIKTIKVLAGDHEIPIRLATKEEIAADDEIAKAIKNAERDRWLAFRAVDAKGNTKSALPADATITAKIGPGTPSAEGPLTTADAQEFSFHTQAPMRLDSARCGSNQTRECELYDQWIFQFSNPLKADVFEESEVRVEPPIEGMKASVWRSNLTIAGTKKANTTYRVTIDKSLRDEFEQTLGKDETVEFKVGSARPWIGMSGQGFVVLDPAAPRQLLLYSTNYQTVKVTLYAVEPQDWFQFQIYRQLHSREPNNPAAKKATLPGRVAFSKQIDLKQSPNEMIETPIDLTPALKDGLGQVIVAVESITPASDNYHSPLLTWVQSTQIGLDAFVDNDALIGWANSLTDGSPLRDVQMQVIPSNVSGATGADGLARLPLKPVSDSAPSVLVARRGTDVAILPENADYWWMTNGSWQQKPQTDELRWYVFDDRKLYRPGEEVHLKGWIRRVGAGTRGDVGPLSGAVKSVSYVVKDEEGNEVGKGAVAPNVLGGFDTSFKLPGTMNLGNAQVEFQTRSAMKAFNNESYTHSFQVQEFRRPEYEVIAKTETEGPLFVGAQAQVSVAANYYAGGGLQNAEVKWKVRATPTNFTPPNRDDYTFGKWIPWWTNEGNNEDSNEKELTGRTDGGGKHRVRIDFDSVKPARPSTVTAEASVEDVNRQAWTGTATMLVHPADLYVGLKSDKTFVQQGEPMIVQTIVTDLDGKATANREIKMRAVRLDWKQIKGEWKQVELNPQECLIKSGLDPEKCTFQSKEGGIYRINATIHDDRGRANETEFTLWVAGRKRPPKTGVEEEKVDLIPDRKEYKPGDTAQILVQAPFYPADAVISLRRSGIVKTEKFHLDSPTYTLHIPIEEAWIPNIHVQVDLVGAEDIAQIDRLEPGLVPAGGTSAASKREAKRPAYAAGEINLSIPPLARKLNVVATPRDKTLEPGSTSFVDIEAKDASGRPVSGGEVAVVVADESVLALTGYRLDDPVSIFYSDRDSGTNDYHSRKNLLLLPANRDTPFERLQLLTNLSRGDAVYVTAESSVNASRIMALPIGGRNFKAEYGRYSGAIVNVVTKSGTTEPPIQLRQNFNALAVFSPSVRTDSNGRAQVQVKLPDNLTRYRVMAIAVADGKQFGFGESAITARLPLMARPSAPRFLNFGDRFELPIVLQNQTDQSMTVDVAVRATNATLADRLEVALVPPAGTSPGSKRNETSTGRRVTVPANDRVEVRIPADAVKAGTARFQIGAVSGRWADAAEVELPVWTPATSEAFATYGEIDNGAINQPVKAPPNIFPQFGGLEIETSSTQLQELTDAVIYLTSYPYECSEQISSRIITIAALRDVLTAFKAKDLPSPPEMEAAVARDLKRLQSMQNQDGGFGFWRRGNESWPYLSIHVAHALARAKQKKFDVPKEFFDKSQKYLREIESHIPADYSIDARRAIIAYSLYVREQMGDHDAARARKLIAEAGLEKLSLESLGWLLSVMVNDQESVTQVQAILHFLNNRVTETAGMAHFVCSYSDSDYLVLNSNRRADGVILEALIKAQPQSDLIPKIVRGLLAHRTRGRWENTQENVFILLALDRYFNTFEKITPNFVARAWLGETFAGEQEFRGRSTDRQQVNVPMRYLAQQSGAQNLIISKDGAGRLYYRVGLNYAPSDLNLKPADYGFTVERSYEGVDDRADVARDADGGWHIKAGARVRVRLTMVATSRRYHVALVDPLPAGFEALNPSLATTGSIPRVKEQTGVTEFGSRSFGYGWWWWRAEWWEHQNLRDERAEAFTSLLWEGVYKYSYVARATTPGVFVVPPAKAEEMYHPETFGRGKTDRVRVE
jgi:uncharacterized protein YfaS (alpha-2-macroglobulin family)